MSDSKLELKNRLNLIAKTAFEICNGRPHPWEWAQEWVLKAMECAYNAGRAESNKETFERAIHLATGCHDYNGGYCGNEGAAFHHGIDTVVSVLRSARDGDKSIQMQIIESIGINATKEQAQ